MTAPHRNLKMKKLDRRVLAALTGRAKLDALLEEAGHPTSRSLAHLLGEAESDVSRCMNGHQDRASSNVRIRDGISHLCDITRAEVDELLGAISTE